MAGPARFLGWRCNIPAPPGIVVSMGEVTESLVDARQRADVVDLPGLFAHERAPMVRLATLLVGSAQLAEDVAQDAFAEVGSRWSGLERPGAYLRTAVVNGCRAVLRRRSVEDRTAPWPCAR
jgi:DNA-directed RNA polymerase specialized sigma24 family protein